MVGDEGAWCAVQARICCVWGEGKGAGGVGGEFHVPYLLDGVGCRASLTQMCAYGS